MIETKTDGILLDITRIDIEDGPQMWGILKMQHIPFRPTQIQPVLTVFCFTQMRLAHMYGQSTVRAQLQCVQGWCFFELKCSQYL